MINNPKDLLEALNNYSEKNRVVIPFKKIKKALEENPGVVTRLKLSEKFKLEDSVILNIEYCLRAEKKFRLSDFDAMAALHGAVSKGNIVIAKKQPDRSLDYVAVHYFDKNDKEVYYYIDDLRFIEGYTGNAIRRSWDKSIFNLLQNKSVLETTFINKKIAPVDTTIYEKISKLSEFTSFENEVTEAFKDITKIGSLKHELWFQTKVQGESIGGTICSELVDRIEGLGYNPQDIVLPKNERNYSINIGDTYERNGMEYSVHHLNPFNNNACVVIDEKGKSRKETCERVFCHMKEYQDSIPVIETILEEDDVVSSVSPSQGQ